MKKEGLQSEAARLGCEFDPKIKRPELIAMVKAKQREGVCPPAAVERDPGNRQLFDQLTQPGGEAQPDTPKDNRGGVRPGAGRKPGVTLEQSKIDNLPIEPNRSVKVGLKWIFRTWARIADCPAIALDDDELQEFAVDVTQSMAYHNIKLPEGLAVDGKLALNAVDKIGGRIVIKNVHKARTKKKRKKKTMVKGNCKRRVIFGKTGSGKTVLARNLVKQIDCDRVLYYDSNGHDYKEGVICEGLEQLKNYWRRVIDGKFRIVYRSAQPRKDFEQVCKLVIAAGNTIFLVDEMDMYFDKSEPCEAFADITRRGRHEDIELVGISQRPRQLGEVRSMAHELFVFDTHEPSDLSYYKQSFSEALVDRIKQLKEFEYVEVILPYDESQLTIRKEPYDGKEGYTAPAEIHRPEHVGDAVGLQSEDGSQVSQGQQDQVD